MDSVSDLPTSDLIVASQNLRARARDLCLQVVESRQRAAAAVARARRIQLVMNYKKRRMTPVGEALASDGQ